MSKFYSALSKTGLWDLGSELNGHTEEARHFMRQVPINRDRYIEILGCGSGTGVFEMAAMRRFGAAHVTAIDANLDMLFRFEDNAEAEGKTRHISLIDADIRSALDFLLKDKSRKFDLAIAGGLLEHLTDPQVAEMMGQVRDLLTEKGIFLHAAVRNTWLARRVLSICRANPPRSRQLNIELVKQAGFEDPKILKLPVTPKFAWIGRIKEAHLFQKAPILSPASRAQSHLSNLQPSQIQDSATQVPSGLPAPSLT